MPRRHSAEAIRQKFIAAGYIPDNDFTYRNNKQKHRVYDILNSKYVHVSLQTLDYNIKKGNRPLATVVAMPYVEDQYTPAPPTDRPTDSLSRFSRNHDEAFRQLPIEVQQATFNDYKQLRGMIGRQKDFIYTFMQPADSDRQAVQMRATILALQDSMPKLLSKGITIRLKITTQGGLERYFHINPTTLNDLWMIFKDVEPDFAVEDSSGNFALSTLDIATIHYTFKQKQQGKQVAAGFFPFINTSAVDLSRYAIYSPSDIEKAAEPCILTAFKASNIMTNNELNQLQEMINTRMFPQQALKHIADHFNISIYVRNYHSHYNGQEATTSTNGKTKSSHVEFTPTGANRTIKLMIMHSHYMLYEQLPGTKLTSYQLIKNMLKDGSLRPYTAREYERVFKAIINNHVHAASGYTAARLIKRMPKAPTAGRYNGTAKNNHRATSSSMYGEHLFGYIPTDVNAALNELQDFVNSIPLRNKINVREYFKFSTLMQRIMYEYGCFDDVYELAGTLRDNIRASLTFPKRVLTTGHYNGTTHHLPPSDGPYYYLDFNGAYCSFMKSIPTGPEANGPPNTKIAELIQFMYDKRKAPTTSPSLARTIKFIMCSCYGTSIAKPKTVKHKWSDNIEATIRNQGDFVASHGRATIVAGSNTVQGFVNIIQPYVEHYSHPHFAKAILDGFNNAVIQLQNTVNVLFQNIDAFVVNEADYNKLVQLGYVHPTELGKLKVEHVFSSMTFYSKMRWYGVNLDGSIFRHCI